VTEGHTRGVEVDSGVQISSANAIVHGNKHLEGSMRG
jgi:hypothetical protein